MQLETRLSKAAVLINEHQVEIEDTEIIALLIEARKEIINLKDKVQRVKSDAVQFNELLQRLVSA